MSRNFSVAIATGESGVYERQTSYISDCSEATASTGFFLQNEGGKRQAQIRMRHEPEA